jgi:hypothetical protein
VGDRTYGDGDRDELTMGTEQEVPTNFFFPSPFFPPVLEEELPTISDGGKVFDRLFLP